MAVLATNEYKSPYYESIEFSVNTGTEDYDVDAQQTTFLAVVGPSSSAWDKYPTEVIIRTNQTISVKFNATTNHAITVTSTDSPLSWRGEVRNIYITNNSGSAAAVKIICLP